MTERSTRATTRLALISAAMAGMIGGTPLAAQALGSDVSSCVFTSSSPSLGQFDSIDAAVAAAREAHVSGGRYAKATVAGRTIAIDGSGVAHGVDQNPCAGSVARPRAPQKASGTETSD